LNSLNLGMFTHEAEASRPDGDQEGRDRHAA
jgi:hypothetical protein